MYQGLSDERVEGFDSLPEQQKIHTPDAGEQR